MRLMQSLGVPDDFAGRPYDYAANQLAHGALGAALTWQAAAWGAPVWVALAAVIAGACAVEVLHIRRGGGWWDSAEDVTFIVGGGILVATQSQLTWWALALLLSHGVWRRS